MKDILLDEIIEDLADNFRNDDEVLENIIEDVINDALYVSNRYYSKDKEKHIKVLKSNIKKAVKSIYLQRGSEGTTSESSSGTSTSYENVIETMKNDIIRQNKRLFI